MQKILKFSISNSDAYEKIFSFCNSFYENFNLYESLSVEKAIFEPKPSWVDGMLKNPKIHDEDYSLLSYLQNPETIILDIGANWGYSAGAFLKLGIKAKIISFEVIQLYGEILEEIVKRHQNQYLYTITGLGDRNDSLLFVVPVINGFADTGLTSASKKPNLEALAINILNSSKNRFNTKDILELGFYVFEAEISTLDEELSKLTADQWSNFPVHAIKIDVEGMECSVLKGGEKMLSKDRPLILAEGSNRTRGIQELLNSLGYFYAERVSDHLEKFDGFGVHSNGFFIHTSRVDEYKKINLLR
jgi:FkbM family methyltransferase